MSRPPVLPETADSLMALIDEMLLVEPMEVDGKMETKAEWRRGRSANLTQVILDRFAGDCREHGAVPIGIRDEITERIPVAQRRDGR